MGQVGDPVASGLVASLARPGGNITGLAGGAAEVIGKVVELTENYFQPLVALRLSQIKAIRCKTVP